MSKLFIEKYNPKTIEQLSYNEKVSNLIQKISTKSDFSHLIFYGPEGSGKKTRIKVLLQSMFNESIHKLKTETKQIKVNSTNVQYSISHSAFHIELTPSDSGSQDRHIIQNVIKEAASNKIANQGTGVKSGNSTLKHNNKVIVIHEADNLSKEAQSSLRRTMEKYSGNCRIILCCNQISKIILPIRSRCLSIRVPSPKINDMTSCLKYIKEEEKLNVNDNQIKKISLESNRNLRSGINILQISKYFK
jgi:replication factor C subunit 3/5